MTTQNTPGRTYDVLTKVGAVADWQRNYITEIEREAATLEAAGKRNILQNYIGKELAFLRDEQSAGLRNTVAAGIEILEAAYDRTAKALAARPATDYTKVRVHPWER